jgi:hypothetical protein
LKRMHLPSVAIYVCRLFVPEFPIHNAPALTLLLARSDPKLKILQSTFLCWLQFILTLYPVYWPERLVTFPTVSSFHRLFVGGTFQHHRDHPGFDIPEEEPFSSTEIILAFTSWLERLVTFPATHSLFLFIGLKDWLLSRPCMSCCHQLA